MFKLHTLLVNTLSKIRKLMNRVIIKRERNKKHLTKNALFDIQSLAKQLYYSQLIIPEDSKLEKIYFLENPISNLMKEDIEQLHLSV